MPECVAYNQSLHAYAFVCAALSDFIISLKPDTQRHGLVARCRASMSTHVAIRQHMCSVQVAEQDELDADAAACSAKRMLAVLDARSPGCRARSRLCSFSCINNPYLKTLYQTWSKPKMSMEASCTVPHDPCTALAASQLRRHICSRSQEALIVQLVVTVNACVWQLGQCNVCFMDVIFSSRHCLRRRSSSPCSRAGARGACGTPIATARPCSRAGRASLPRRHPCWVRHAPAFAC